jgi:hypothetical protein
LLFFSLIICYYFNGKLTFLPTLFSIKDIVFAFETKKYERKEMDETTIEEEGGGERERKE